MLDESMLAHKDIRQAPTRRVDIRC